MKNRFLLLSFIFFCLISTPVWAAEEKISTALKGDAITTASTGVLRIQDQDFGLNISNTYYHKTAVHAILRIDDRTRRKYTDNWRLIVTYNLKVWGHNNNQLSYNSAHSLAIDFMRQGSMNDIALNVHEIGASIRKAQLTITSLKKELLHDDGSVLISSTVTTLTDSMFKDVFLELEYKADKYKKLGTSVPAPGHWVKDHTGAAIMNPGYVLSASGITNSGCAGGVQVPGNEVTFYWPTIDGAESYDLEWLFVDAGDDPLCSTDYDFDWGDATRINTKWNFYTTALLYPRGKIVYRVRAVGVSIVTNVPDKIERGPWSSGPGAEGSTSMNHSFNYSGLEPGMNWTANITYAEEGKQRSVLEFYDGTGNERQAISYLNTDSLALISENKYDHQGRQTLTLLPTVHEYSGLAFTHNLNIGFDKNVFDRDTVFANGSIFTGITTGTVTGHFYSSQNPFLTYTGNYYPKMLRRTLAAYQADAEGFPFGHERRSNDGLNRIEAKGEPGYAQRLGSGHDTRYYYGAPGSQAELDRLFGNEVGYVGNYRKEMVVDPNGQVSVSYKDGHDRVIATALAGTNVSDKLHLLPSAQTVTLTSGALDNNHLNGQNELESSKSLLVSVPNTQFTLNYTADTLLFRDLCLGDQPCAFEVSISITDQEGRQLLDFDGNSNTAEPTWRPFNALTGFSYTHTITFPEIGKYTLIKRVRLNSGAISTIKSAVSSQLGTDTASAGACFIPPVYELPCRDCQTSCEESFRYNYIHNGQSYVVYHTDSAGLAGLTTNTTLATVVSEGLTPLFGLIGQSEADSIEALILECKSYCSQSPSMNTNTECELLLGILKRDMVPGGQYFDNRPQSPTVDTLRTDADYYQSADGDPYSINHWLYNYGAGFNTTLGNLIGIVNADWDTLRSRWDDVETAPGFEAVMDQFVQLHPEYCIWKSRCENRDDTCSCNRPGAQQVYHSITQYEDALYATSSDSVAREYMLFLPMGVPLSAPLDVFNPTQINAQDLESGLCYKDPLISDCIDSAGTYSAAVNNYLFNYLAAGAETLSIWEVLADPDGIHLLDTATYTGPIPLGLITYMQVLHGNGSAPGTLAAFGQIPTQGQISLFTFFRSAYEAIRMQIKQQRGTDEFAGCAPADHPLINLIQNASSVPNDLQAAITKLPYLNTLDGDNDGYLDINLSPYGYATNPAMDYSRFQVRIPYLNLQIPPTYGGLSATYCDNVVQNLPLQWIQELESSLNGCVKLDITNPDTLQTLPYLIPQNEKDILRNYFEVLVSDACSVYTASLITASPLPALFNSGSAPVSVYSTLPWGLPAANNAQEIIDVFMNQTGTQGCPTPGTIALNDTSAWSNKQEINCNCSRLRDVLYASGTLKTPYQQINPLQYTAFTGVTVTDVFDMNRLLDYLSDMDSHLLSPYDSLSLYTGGSVLLANWINVCAGIAATDTSLPFQGVFMQGLRCSTPGTTGILTSCEQDYIQYYRSLKNQAFIVYRDTQLQRFDRLYEPVCLERLLNGHIETFTVSYALNEYHYTLYYYDRAGNLVKTVPPQGVVPLNNQQELTRIDAFRRAHSWKENYATITDPGLGSFARPSHFRTSLYQHNSKDQVIRERSPDAGESWTYYDFLGRLALSRNARQIADGTSTYTLYDPISREYETGEWLTHPDSLPITGFTDLRDMIQALPSDSLFGMTPLGFLLDLDHNRRQITRNYYDRSHFTDWNFGYTPIVQKNLRSRVSSTAYYEQYPSHWRFFDNAQHYSYDVHGNVSILVQDIPLLQPFGKRFLKTEYGYDLISGKTNEIHYMRDQPEHFSQYYRYDADNRLVRMYSSANNGVVKELEAKYYYHLTAPLARIELGRKQVQGIDYTYTLQGWHKGINSDLLNPHNDRGADGLAGDNLHSSFGVDAMGYTLAYYKGDYKPLGSGGSFYKSRELDVPSGSMAYGLMNISMPPVAGDFGLYNGNIVKMVSNTLGCDGKPMDVLGQFFQYDQLHRLYYSNNLKKANNGSWTAPNATDWNTISHPNEIFRMEMNYDADGNITSLYRTDGQEVVMDALQYNYEPSGLNSALLYVTDNITSNTHQTDIKNQGQGNYQYDPIGNLTVDIQNDSALIGWNLNRKVHKVNFRQGADLWFGYNADAHRIIKRIDATQEHGASMHVYALDAQGNILAIYEINQNLATGKYKLQCTQRTIHGMERLGINEQKVVFSEISGYDINEPENSIYEHFNPQSLTTPPAWEAPGKIYVSLGQKQYELSNHLGNILSTISDRKVYDAILDTDASNELKRYRPEVRMATEYYPFGAPLPDWGCSTGIQCSTSVITQTSEIALSNFVNNIQKSGQTTTTPDCSGSRSSPQCVRIDMPHTGDMAWLNFKPNQTGTQQLSTSIQFISEDYLHSLTVLLLEMDSAGTKVVDTVFVNQVENSGDTVKHTINYFNADRDKIYRVTYLQRSTGQTSFRWLNAKLMRVTETYVRECGSQAAGEGGYLYGFNGAEKENSLYGIEGSAYMFEYRIHDVRLGRFLSVDPLSKEYPWNSAYAFAENRVIDGIDLEGAESANASTTPAIKPFYYGGYITTAQDNASTAVRNPLYDKVTPEKPKPPTDQIRPTPSKIEQTDKYFSAQNIGHPRTAQMLTRNIVEGLAWEYTTIKAAAFASRVGTGFMRTSYTVAPTFTKGLLARSTAFTLDANRMLYSARVMTYTEPLGRYVGGGYTNSAKEFIFNAGGPIFNSKGVPYPQVHVRGYGLVPFPKGPFLPNNSKVLRSSFTAQYKLQFKEWWIGQGRPWPIVPQGSTLNIHHIKPLSHGGTNTFDNLVPLIQPQEHQPFTNWWRNFKE